MHGRLVSLGFAAGIPGYLGLGDGVNLLDRLKVRASATFLFGLIHFSRSEADLSTEFMGWHTGPIRLIRGQRQWVRLGWGIHSPTFGSYTYFYRDFAELPVGLYLNFKPTHFFGNILVQAVLDFRDLRGWSLLVPSRRDPIPIDGTMTADKAALEQRSDTWFALRGPQVTLVESMAVSPSLATVRHRLVYRETTQPVPPEAVPGEEPGIGFQLDQWERIGAGAHQIASVSYALPPDVDVRAFMRARGVPLQVHVGLPSSADTFDPPAALLREQPARHSGLRALEVHSVQSNVASCRESYGTSTASAPIHQSSRGGCGPGTISARSASPRRGDGRFFASSARCARRAIFCSCRWRRSISLRRLFIDGRPPAAMLVLLLVRCCPASCRGQCDMV